MTVGNALTLKYNFKSAVTTRFDALTTSVCVCVRAWLGVRVCGCVCMCVSMKSRTRLTFTVVDFDKIVP